MTLNYLLYFCTPAKISIIFKYEHITPKKWMRSVKPKKALGQHFLKDLQIAERIADTLSDYKQLPVLEIGPGMGVLTQFLLEKGHDLTVVELDMESVDYLEQNFPALEGKILAEDFLRLDLGKLFPDQFCVIGNYPYNISSQIFFKVLDYKEHIPCCSGMIQKEVAERLAAGPGCKTYGILSVLLQAWYEVEYLFTVSEHVFDPPPKVKSAVIRMVRNDRKSLGCDEKLFKTVVKTSFNQRRKTLRNSMKPLLGKDCPDYSLPIFDKRQTKSSINKAKLQKQTSQLDLLDNQKTLYKTIESLWLAANSAQQQYVAAARKLKSTETSYSLVSEQFNVGMKNTVELLTEKNNLLNAQQETLQAKYTAILNAGLLRFYQGEEINLF